MLKLIFNYISLFLLYDLYFEINTATKTGMITATFEKNDNKNNQLQNIIGEIVQEMQFQNRCMVFITDSYYYKIIDVGQIRATEYIPIYQIFLFDSEILSPPRNRLKSILEESHKSGCNSYIILVSNGIQVIQFLEYGERERLIHTRGYFLFMHDYRILRPEMSYIWNRILNVVFLHKYSVSYHKSGVMLSREWINLETVHFPVQFHTYVVTERVDTWYNDYFLFGGNHFLQKTSDLNNQKIRIAVFEHIPAVIKDAIQIFESNPATNERPSLGTEFELILYIAKALNFKAEFYKPLNVETEKWGWEVNDSYNGLLGEAIAGKATFYLGDFYNTLKHHRLLDLSQSYNTECLTCLTPELLSDTSWKLLILPFKLYTWITVISTLFLGSAIVYFFSQFYKTRISYNKSLFLNIPNTGSPGEFDRMLKSKEKEIRKTFKEENEGLYMFTEAQNSILYIYSMVLQVSLPLMPRAWAIRVFVGWWWIYSILISVSYKASMTATLANPVEKKTVDTIQDLGKSSLEVGGWVKDTKELFEISDDPIIQKIGEKFKFINNESEAINYVTYGQFAYYENSNLLQQLRVMRQLVDSTKSETAPESNTKTYKDRNLHVMRECIINMPISIGLEKNSALKPQVDRLIRSAVEAGLVEKWLSDVMEWSKIAEKKFEDEPTKALINFQKLQGALVALGIGYILGLIALISEIYYWKLVVLKDPNYDKYYLDKFYGHK